MSFTFNRRARFGLYSPIYGGCDKSRPLYMGKIGHDSRVCESLAYDEIQVPLFPSRARAIFGGSVMSAFPLG